MENQAQSTNPNVNPNQPQTEAATKFCKFCGSKIAFDAILCPHCGRQVEELKTNAPATPQVVINNTNTNANVNANVNGAGYRKACNKWTAFFLCLFLGFLGAHKFYEGKVGMGILYICTGGLVGIGWIIDLITILFKPNPYFV